MADHFWGKIEIGGNLQAIDLPVFCQMAGIAGFISSAAVRADSPKNNAPPLKPLCT